MRPIIIKHSILIHQSKKTVWDFTQNYDNRTQWDKTVLEVTVIESSPRRIVNLKMKGNTSMIFIYKLDDRPNKTSLVATEIKSAIIERAGGSWSYEDVNGSTLWTQTNSIELKDNFLLRLLKPLLRQLFLWQTRKAMKNLKNMMERN